jgi:hypothetical protein
MCPFHIHNPRRSHEQELIRIGKHLKWSIDKVLIFKPHGMLQIDCYVDADFAGLWSHEEKDDPLA